LATKSLSDLRTQNALNGSVKSEAEDLTKILRESLGENVLVPSTGAKPVAQARPAHPVRRPRKGAAVAAVPASPAAPSSSAPAAAPASAPTPAAKSDSSGSGPNPFGGLK
jgi:hypothetical protein